MKIGNGGDRRRQGKWQSQYLYHVGAQRVYLFSRTRNLLFLSAQERGDNSKGLKGDVRKERGRREKSGGSLSVGIWFSMVETLHFETLPMTALLFPGVTFHLRFRERKLQVGLSEIGVYLYS